MFVRETASDFFNELLQAVRNDDIQNTYRRYHRSFIRCINQQTALTNVELVGTFAKTDYLLKEFNAPYELVNAVNDMRIRLRGFIGGTISDCELGKYAKYDFKTLCVFVSTIFSTEMPPDCREQFPKGTIEKQRRRLLDKDAEYKRMIVSSWDDTFLYGTMDAESVEKVIVCYAHGNKFYNYDWTYLSRLLYPNAQLNIIRPRIEDGIIYPELIIFEPDYLVDISAVAACFENYATSPLIHLVDKLKPSVCTEPIVLGNLAGWLLDEEMNNPECTYSECVGNFYNNNALSLLTADLSAKFHSDAIRQKANIHKAITETLPRTVSKYDRKEVMTEPSFFSEMLGLQGRLDFLQLDHRVLIEQKSGKCGFPQQNPDTPVINRKHYVQILLYMALIRYNYREIYEKNNRQLHAFLLYSKYKNSLLGVSFAPELLFEALKVRNGIAWSEIYCSKGGIRLLATLTADKLNRNHVNDKLWNGYQKPQLEALLSPIRHASELERAYYIRFLTFIEKEHLLSKLGSRTKENSGFASIWTDSLEDKIQAGNIYTQLTLLSPDTNHKGAVESIVLRINGHGSDDMSNFRKGDIVILYPYTGKIPDARRSMVFRCAVEDIQADKIKLHLRVRQSDAHVLTRSIDSHWAIEHDFIEASFSSLYRGMHAFLSAPKERRDLLLFQRAPRVDTTKRLTGDYGAFNELSLRVRQAMDFFLIIGPPGTGKTSYGLVNTLKEELSESGSSVLLLSYTNRAVDEICSKLTEEKLDFIRIGGKLSCAEEYHQYLLENRARTCSNVKALKDTITSARILVGTTTAFNAHTSIFELKQFTLAIIDEASQILEPHLIPLLSACHDNRPAIKKFVMIGDHKQLPAVVRQTQEDSKVTEPALNSIMLTDCRLSLFERLLKKYGNDKSVTYMLTRQGRMHHDIAEFPNIAFYNNTLKEVPLPHQQRKLDSPCGSVSSIADILDTCRVSFIDVTSAEDSLPDKVNRREAEIIADIVEQIYRRATNFDTATTVGVIVPYRNQIATVRSLIDRRGIPVLHGITIDTVERYQGNQRDFIIYGFTIKKYYQLTFLTDNTFEENGCIIDRKLNVAMTRAKESLILVGNASLLSRDTVFRNLIRFMKSKGKLFHFSVSL